MLSPRWSWGANLGGTGAWLEEALRANVAALREARPTSRVFRRARVGKATGVWLA